MTTSHVGSCPEAWSAEYLAQCRGYNSTSPPFAGIGLRGSGSIKVQDMIDKLNADTNTSNGR